MAVVPIWAHYDEPTHYEYLRYVTIHRRLPTPGEPDDTILREIAGTVDGSQISGCESASPDIPLCVSPAHQFDEMPGYYVLQAFFQMVFAPADVAGRVQLSRLISVALAVSTAWLAYASARRAFPQDTLLALSTALMMGLIPGYVDLMSALSNDVGAVAAFTFLNFALTTAILKEGHARSLPAVGLGLAACVLAKSSAWIGLAVAGIGLLLAYWPRLSRSLRIASGVSGAIVLIATFRWQPGVGPLLREGIDRLLPAGGANWRLESWYTPANWPHYFAGIRWQFVTFWAAFANGEAGLPRAGIAILAAISLFAAVGLIIALVWLLRPAAQPGYQQRILIFYALATLTALGMSLARIDPPGGYMPTARHFYTAIAPTVTLFLIGLGNWFPPVPRGYTYGLLMLVLYAMGIWSLVYIQIPFFLNEWPSIH
ncbi:MAG: glycosyltransferase family 39 protein [Anaerolineae bacterium]